jgi:hypothetical protein
MLNQTIFGKRQSCLSGFLRPLKHADPDLPVVKEAKAEYAKLQ